MPVRCQPHTKLLPEHIANQAPNRPENLLNKTKNEKNIILVPYETDLCKKRLECVILTYGTFVNDDQLIVISHVALPVMQCGGTDWNPHECTNHIHDRIRELPIRKWSNWKKKNGS